MEAHTPQLYLCAICKGKFQFKNVKYSKDGKRIICADCYSKDVKNTTKKETKDIKTTNGQPIKETIKIICVNCNYKFSYKKGSNTKLMCPYCGGNRLMRDNITADKLIEEVSKSGDVY